MNHETMRQFGAHIEVGLLRTVPRRRGLTPAAPRWGARYCMRLSVACSASAIELWSRLVWWDLGVPERHRERALQTSDGPLKPRARTCCLLLTMTSSLGAPGRSKAGLRTATSIPATRRWKQPWTGRGFRIASVWSIVCPGCAGYPRVYKR